jgi:acetyltransferase
MPFADEEIHLPSLPDTSVRLVLPDELDCVLPELVELLIDTVHGGEPLGFLQPLTHEQARSYWFSLRADLQAGSRLLLVACRAHRIVGSGQLVLSPWSNSPHRAELQKLCVSVALRGQGIGKAVMAALHAAAAQRGRSLLVLNTRHGGAAQALYQGLGYKESGVLPGWTIGAAGEQFDHVTLYRHLASS